jgi:hypothetical protein
MKGQNDRGGIGEAFLDDQAARERRHYDGGGHAVVLLNGESGLHQGGSGGLRIRSMIWFAYQSLTPGGDGGGGDGPTKRDPGGAVARRVSSGGGPGE